MTCTGVEKPVPLSWMRVRVRSSASAAWRPAWSSAILAALSSTAVFTAAKFWFRLSGVGGFPFPR